jgi:uncharacterized membrane protein YczE
MFSERYYDYFHRINDLISGHGSLLRSRVGLQSNGHLQRRSSSYDHVSYGTANLIANLALLAVLVILARSYVKAGTLLCVFTIGPWINLFTPMMAALHISAWHMALRLACTVLGTGLMGLGLGLYVAVDRGFGALEGLVKYACAKKGMSYSLAKVIQDVMLVGGGIALGATWGIGTLVAIVFTGPAIQWSIQCFSKRLAPKRETT